MAEAGYLSKQRPGVVGRARESEIASRAQALASVVQRAIRRQDEDPSDHAIRAAAQRGLQSPTASLPFHDQVQRAFGRHDISHVQAHLGHQAAASARQMSASAYATGNHIVFADGPDLRTAAHEMAHVIQQRAGLQLAGGVGRVGDRHEQHAESVADRVASGQSAEALLDQYAAPSAGAALSHPAREGDVQRSFKIKRGNRYDKASDLPLSRIRGMMVGKTQTQIDDAIRQIEAWANDAADKGEFTWQEIIDQAFAQSSTMDLENLGSYSPTHQSTPPDTPVFTAYRRYSNDFSAMFEAEFGSATADIRKTSTVLEHKTRGDRGTTFGTGRFMTMTGPKVLGDTRYEEFLPSLPALTGLTESGVAQAIIDGLLDNAAFVKTLGTLSSDKGREALTQTVRLMNNEILHRSSINLIAIIGAAKRTIKDPTKGLGDRLEASGLFVPQGKDHNKIGGQQLSRIHHPDKQDDLIEDLDDDLTEIWENNKKALKSTGYGFVL